MTKPTVWHLHPFRVRYQETDQMGVVFYGNYLTWFEIGRTELVRYLGMSYSEIEQSGMLLPVVDVNCSYISPARYDEWVVACTAIEHFSPIRIAFRSEVRRIAELDSLPTFIAGDEPPGELLAKGGTRHVWVNANWKPARVEKLIPELYEGMKKIAAGELPVDGGE